MEKRNSNVKKKFYHTEITGYSGDEKRMIKNLRKCTRKERLILMTLVEKTAMHLTNLDDLEGLLK